MAELGALGYSGEGEYQSEYDYGETFAIVNKDATLRLDPHELESRINEDAPKGQPEIKAFHVYELDKDEKFFSGPYIDTTGANIIKEPKFEAHFEMLAPAVKSGLKLWLNL